VYLLTIIDRSTRWFEAVPLKNMEACMCVDAFISSWVARFGVPGTVTTDRGTQFTSALWSSTYTSLGIKQVLTTAYHPQSNSMVECVHRQLKDALRVRGAGPAWRSHLPWVLLGLRAASKEDSAVSSAELVTGTPLVLPGQLLQVPNPPRVNVPPPPTSYAAAANTPPAHLAQAEHVYVRVGGQLKPLAAPYAGPYLVLSKGAKTFTIQVGQWQEIVSVDRLKRHTGLGPVSPAEAASRGRPPKMSAAPSIQPASS
jgi:hypothetical protein